MARTLVGILQILLKQDVTKRAPEVNRALHGIQQTAARLGNAPWGAAFERQLDKLRITPAERTAISQSYGLLARDIQGKIARADLNSWKGGVLSNLAAVRAQMVATGNQARATSQIIRTAFAGGVLGGIASYGIYAGTRGGIGAAFEQERAEAQAKFAGLPEEDRNRIKAASEELSAKWGIFSGDAFTMLKEASLSMPSTDIALGAGETMAKLFVVLESMFGREGALSGVYALNRALDNVEMNLTPEMYENALDQYVKAQQVLGKDLSPEQFAQALKYARISGKALSEDFLFSWLPILAAETSGSDAGTQTRALFDQLIGGRIPAKAKGLMQGWGVMDAEGNLTGADVYGQNPTIWAHDVLLPLLKEAGIDTENEVSLARALTQMTNNRLASDNLARSILSFEQYLRTATEYAPRAMGLDAASEVRNLDPFAAVTGVTNSLKNLAAAVGEHAVPVIIPFMTSFAAGVEAVAAAVRGAEGWQVGLGAVAGAVGAFGAFKMGSAVLGGMTALTTAGPSLQTAAVMLQGAAQRLGGGPLSPGIDPSGKPPGGRLDPSLMMLAPWIAETLGTYAFDAINGEGATAQSKAVTEGAWERTMQRIFGSGEAETVADPAARIAELRAEIARFETLPVVPTEVGFMKAEIEELEAGLRAANTTIAPQVDTSSIDSALLKIARLKAAMDGVGGSIGPRVKSQIEGLYADYGVAP